MVSDLFFSVNSRPFPYRLHTTVINARNMKSVSRTKLSSLEGFSNFERTSSKNCPFFKCSSVCKSESGCFMRETVVKWNLFLLEFSTLYEVYDLVFLLWVLYSLPRMLYLFLKVNNRKDSKARLKLLDLLEL